MADVLGRLLLELENLVEVSEALLAITIVTVALRLVSRLKYAGGLKPEDYVCILAVVCKDHCRASVSKLTGMSSWSSRLHAASLLL